MTNDEARLFIEMVKMIGTMSLELRYYRKEIGQPGHLEMIPPYDALAEQFQTQLLQLEKGLGTAASSEAAKSTYASLQEILKFATEIASGQR